MGEGEERWTDEDDTLGGGGMGGKGRGKRGESREEGVGVSDGVYFPATFSI